jgi:hypothetical protein
LTSPMSILFIAFSTGTSLPTQNSSTCSTWEPLDSSNSRHTWHQHNQWFCWGHDSHERLRRNQVKYFHQL